VFPFTTNSVPSITMQNDGAFDREVGRLLMAPGASSTGARYHRLSDDPVDSNIQSTDHTQHGRQARRRSPGLQSTDRRHANLCTLGQDAQRQPGRFALVAQVSSQPTQFRWAKWERLFRWGRFCITHFTAFSLTITLGADFETGNRFDGPDAVTAPDGIFVPRWDRNNPI
jgi:hypothetical protein